MKAHFSRLRISNSALAVFFALLVVFSLAIRLYQISPRPLHNDESANHHFVQSILKSGYYPYSHENYHGPSYFYLLTAFVKVFGDSEFGLRLSVVFLGLLLLLLPLIIRRYSNDWFVVFSALLLSASSSLLYYSRYSIHEILLVLSSSVFALYIYSWHRLRRPLDIYIIASSLAVMVATKETFIITGFALFLSLLSLGDWSGVLRDLKRQEQHVYFSLCLFVLIVFAFFTGFFQWSGGIRELFTGVQQWVGRSESDVGHHKSPEYYFNVFVQTEPYLALFYAPTMAIVTLALYLNGKSTIYGYSYDHVYELTWKWFVPMCTLILSGLLVLILLYRQSFFKKVFSSELSLPRFLLVWSFVIFIVYAFVPYKTPWLIINFSVPGILFIAWCLGQLAKNGGNQRILGLLIFFPLLFLGAKKSLQYNYKVQLPPALAILGLRGEGSFGLGNPFAYVHTGEGIIDLANDVNAYFRAFPSSNILVGSSHYWPLPYYTRGFPSRLIVIKISDTAGIEKYTKEQDIVMVDDSISWTHDSNWDVKRYYIMDSTWVKVFFRKR